MMVAKISTEHKVEVDRLESEFNRQITILNESEKHLKEMLVQSEIQNHDLNLKNQETTILLTKLQEEISRSLKTHEEEVQLRL